MAFNAFMKETDLMPIYNLMIISASNWPIVPVSGDEVDNRF
jgi:hypothetical protein